MVVRSHTGTSTHTSTLDATLEALSLELTVATSTRTPVLGATQREAILVRNDLTTTHASRTGCDWTSQSVCRPALHFNSRTHTGAT